MRLISPGVNCTNLTRRSSDDALAEIGNLGSKIHSIPCKFREIKVTNTINSGDVSDGDGVGSVSNMVIG